MLARIIKVGNSKGIRIPSAILKKCNITDQVELELKEDSIIIKHLKEPRAGWDSALKNMHDNGDDNILIDSAIDAEIEDWQWQ